MTRSGIAVALALTLAACNNSPDTAKERSAPRETATSTPARPVPPATASPAPGPTNPEQPQPSGTATAAGWTHGRIAADLGSPGVSTLRGMRTARQPGFDRFVLDFGDSPLPSYQAEYVDRPQHQCGSGEEVRLAGDAWLQLDLQPARGHDDAGAATLAQRASKPALPNLVEVRLICDFEAQVSWVLGVRTPTDFRILQLATPNRLVVDIKH